MGKKKKKKRVKIKYGRFSIFLLFLFVIIYASYQMIITHFFTTNEIYEVSYDTLVVEESTKVLAIRNEILIASNISGNANYLVQEGDRIEEKTPIVEIINDGEYKVNDDTTNNAGIQQDYDRIAFEINNIKEDIVLAVEMENYELLSDLNYQLKVNLDTKKKMQEQHKFLANRENQYLTLNKNINTNITGNKKRMSSPSTGLFTTRIDGYENEYSLNKIYEIDYKTNLNRSYTIRDIQANTVQINQPIFKIVDDTTMNFVASISFDEIELYKELKEVKLNIEDEFFDCQVKDVFGQSDMGLVWLQTSDFSNKFIENRVFEGKLVQENYKGIKIYSDSVVYKDDRIGIYELNQNNELNFVPINIIAEYENFAVVSADKYYDSSEGIVRTVSSGSKVMRYAENYKENQKIIE